jgi:hypothetical protein
MNIVAFAFLARAAVIVAGLTPEGATSSRSGNEIANAAETASNLRWQAGEHVRVARRSLTSSVRLMQPNTFLPRGSELGITYKKLVGLRGSSGDEDEVHVALATWTGRQLRSGDDMSAGLSMNLLIRSLHVFGLTRNDRLVSGDYR